MITTEKINGKDTVIAWTWGDLIENFDGAQWSLYEVEGESIDGRIFIGSCQSDSSHNYCADVENIEEILIPES